MTTPDPSTIADISTSLASRTTAHLIEGLRYVDDLIEHPETSQANQRALTLARHWIIHEIETRHNIRQQMDEWAESLTDHRTYTQALIDALPDNALH